MQKATHGKGHSGFYLKLQFNIWSETALIPIWEWGQIHDILIKFGQFLEIGANVMQLINWINQIP